MLKHLNEKNDVTIYSVTDPCFETYGRMISNINCNELISFMEQNTVIPEKGNIYVASVEELEHTWEIKDNTYRIEDAKVFFVEKGTAIEMYQTTLHLSPCRVSDIGFKDVVILPRGTNTPLNNGGTDEAAIGEERLLLQRNKWVIAHPDREPLIKQGAYPGLLGENKELYY